MYLLVKEEVRNGIITTPIKAFVNRDYAEAAMVSRNHLNKRNGFKFYIQEIKVDESEMIETEESTRGVKVQDEYDEESIELEYSLGLDSEGHDCLEYIYLYDVRLENLNVSEGFKRRITNDIENIIEKL